MRRCIPLPHVQCGGGAAPGLAAKSVFMNQPTKRPQGRRLAASAPPRGSKETRGGPAIPSEREAYVYIQIPGTLDTVPAALLRVQTLPDGTQIGRFRYGDRYLRRHDAVALDPFQLPLDKTVYEFTRLKGIPGAVRDAAPDAWGRRVIEHKLERNAADLQEIDYLLHGPQDGAGCLSFGLKAEPPAPKRPYNRTHQLAELIAATKAIEQGRPVAAHLLEQLEPGTSMGGARPKATIEDAQHLWLAKFPANEDRFNLQRVEYATLDLARRCGLSVTQTRLQAVGGADVLMLQRFDRDHTDNGYLRFGLVSGLTVLDAGDSHLDRDRWSYPLLADNLRRWSDKPEADCAELFRRMVFNAAVTNNDDHPRNHALLRRHSGWRLSPAYDLVPTPVLSLERRDLALTIGTYGRTASLYNLLSQAGHFGLSAQEARAEIDRLVAVVRQWRKTFVACGVSTRDVDHIAPAMLPACFFFDKSPGA
jgi:serine/threonine-protein kinase HipA